MSDLKRVDFSFLHSKEKWKADEEARFDLDELTRSFHESVPSLQFLDWSIRNIRRGFSETVLPLNITSTNQYVTHQAALQLLAADYTGGIALCSLFQMVPIVGFHPMESDYGAYVWGAKATIKWYYPSCDDLICRAEIPEEDWGRLAKRFFNGQKVIVTIPVKMYNGNRLIAQSDFTYWAQSSHSLRDNAFDESKVHVLYDHKFKTSARLIAGLRAIEQEKPTRERLFDDAYAFMAAQNHGIILAKRFCQYMPQIQPMVAARTKNLDELILSLDGEWQIVNIGTGLDCRAWRLTLETPTFYELDLPLMIKTREEVLPSISDANGSVFRIPIDLRYQNIDEAVSQHSSFDANKQTLVIWEGGSMYFDKSDTDRIFKSVSKLLTNTNSKLWFDFVSDAVVQNSTCIPTIEAFVRGMRRMGEPFINGYTDIRGLLKKHGLEMDKNDKSNLYINYDDPIYDHYTFCTAKKSI